MDAIAVREPYLMPVTVADRNWSHLYPPFRGALERAYSATTERTGLRIKLLEGYRSPERQLWLYAQGRTRPGPIVTKLKVPRWHGAGLAADGAPFRGGQVIWTPGDDFWGVLWEEARKRGLSPIGMWDAGHLQLADTVLRRKALAWVRRGFKDG